MKNSFARVSSWLGFLIVFLPGVAIADVAGMATVLDGNSLQFETERVRLMGVDAPDPGQTCIADGQIWNCGADAAKALADRIGESVVMCRGAERDANGNLLAICFAGRDDINQWLVSEGLAVANRQQSGDYTDEESIARLSRRGIWRGEFTLPSLWREGQRISGQAISSATGECIVKGDITDRGIRVYHEPGGKLYEGVEIDTAAGERWFCSAEEAQRHGFRPAKE